MSCTVIKMNRPSRHDFRELPVNILASFEEKPFAPELVYQELSDVNGVPVFLMVFEKFYLRNSSTTAATVQILDSGTEQIATIIGTGGGSGVLNTNYGSHADLTAALAAALAKYGFTKVDV